MNKADTTNQIFQYDFDRALSARFASHSKRHGLLLPTAFDHELSKIRSQTSDPLLQRIRIQFWRDALLEKTHAPPLALELLEVFGSRADMLNGLIELIDLHDNDCDQPELAPNRLQAICERQAVLFRLSCEYLDETGPPITPEFFSHCGHAYGGLVVLENRLVLDTRGDEGVDKILAQMKTSLEAVGADLSNLSVRARLAVLPLALVLPYLKRFKASDKTTGQHNGLSAFRKLWIIWRTARNGF